MKTSIGRCVRIFCVLMTLGLLMGMLVACAGSSEIPDGYQYATCSGEYFRLFVPTQWTVNTESGISGAFYSHTDEVTVTMTQVPFAPSEELSAEESLEAFYESHLAEISQMKDYQQEKSFNSTLTGYRAKDITYTATVTDKVCRVRQVLTRVSGRYYLFTYSAKAEVFEQWLDIVDDILLNITFESYPYEGENERKIPDKVTPPEGMKLVSDDEVAYRFFVPEAWIREVNVGQNLVYASEEDRSNVSVIAYYPEENEAMTIQEYWVLCRDEYTSALKDFTLISETESTMGERDAMIYEYTYTLGGVTYHVRQVVTKHSAMIYNMTYTALPEQYEAHLEDVVAMQEAFTFRKFGE